MLDAVHLYAPHSVLRTLTDIRASFPGHNKQVNKTLKNTTVATNRKAK